MASLTSIGNEGSLLNAWLNHLTGTLSKMLREIERYADLDIRDIVGEFAEFP